MLPENVFRFVSVRPPQSREPDDLRDIEERTASLEIVVAVEEERSQNGKSGDEARRSVGDKIIFSSYYFRNHPSWLKLYRGRADFNQLVASLSDIPGVQEFIQAAERLLGALYGGNAELGTWLESEEFGELKRTLWKSYYANVLSPWQRPSDREELVFWIRLFRLFETAVGEQDKYESFVAILPKSRPAVPAVLFRPDPERIVTAPAQPVSRSEDKVQLLEDEVKKLETARAQINMIYQKKLARSMHESTQIQTTQAAYTTQPSEGAQEQVDGNMENRQGIMNKVADRRIGNGTQTRDLPWRLSAKDVDEYDGLKAVLETIGLLPDITLVPDAIAKIEAAMARVIAELVPMQERTQIVGIGPRAVIVRRSIPRLPVDRKQKDGMEEKL